MHNLYLFRNQITSRVLVSPTFRMHPSILAQIAEHRPQATIRPDHWVPFAILTGIRSPSTIQSLTSNLTTTHQNPIGKYRFPLPIIKPNPFEPKPLKRADPLAPQPQKQQRPKRDPLGVWTVPEEVKEKTIRLCKVLNTLPEIKEEVESGEEVEADARYTLWWERDEYRHLIEASTEGWIWPEFVEHRKLKLVRNRYPDVPGFDMKALNDARV